MTRVLFVDDERTLLRAIDRALRLKQPSWTMRFAESGADALQLLEQEAFDIIVSDISMPTMDGVTLLANVKSRFPHMARLALSGGARPQDRIRAARTIHQWLAKPCPMTKLNETIEHLGWGRGLVDDPIVVGLALGAETLPSAPALYLTVAEALEREVALEEISALIEHDVGSAAKLLQLVNSAFFGESRRITSVALAAEMIGMQSLRELLLASELMRASPDAEAVTRRGVLAANIARSLASEHHDDVFLAGLLHGVGTLVLGPEVTVYRSAIASARLGGLLLSTWGIPIEVARAVAYHTDPESAPDPADPRLAVVAMATARARMLDGA
jgi:CheY-like chemotaxis protein